MSDTCRCPHADALECARIRHVVAFDDFERSMQMEEADYFDAEDACECKCHEREDEYYDDYEEVQP